MHVQYIKRTICIEGIEWKYLFTSMHYMLSYVSVKSTFCVTCMSQEIVCLMFLFVFFNFFDWSVKLQNKKLILTNM